MTDGTIKQIKKVKKILGTTIEIILGIVAAIVAIGVIGLFGMHLAGIPYLGFMALVVYLIVPRKWGVIGFSIAIIVASVYLAFMLLFAIFWQPVFCLMSSILSVGATILIARGKPLWMCGVIASIFLIIGVYYVFNNDIVGPMEFFIRDRPVDTPSQWFHCYRFFWTGIVVETVSECAGLVSVILMSGYMFYPKVKDFPRKFLEKWCS